MERIIKKFLDKNCDFSRPCLLALSGGPDSMALFNLLIDYSKTHPLKLAVAHVDHGWRKESGNEREQLKKMVTSYCLPFHELCLSVATIKGNLEEGCREKRLQFFSQLAKKYNYQAVLLGHHQDDQIETVLMQMLEGKSLSYLSGIGEVSHWKKLLIWRPLLGVKKAEILSWLKSKRQSFFLDSTNKNKAFLRARMRQDTLPLLEKSYGKKISGSLLRIATESMELRNHLDAIVDPVIKNMKYGNIADFLDLTNYRLSRIAIKHLIKMICHYKGHSYNHTQINLAASLIDSGAQNKIIHFGDQPFLIDRSCLIIPKSDFPNFSNIRVALSNGVTYFGSWKVSVSNKIQPQKIGWKNLLSGALTISLPIGDYDLSIASPMAPFPRTSPIKKWWNNHKVPAFFRQFVPVFYQGAQLKYELLTGKIQPVSCYSSCLNITLEYLEEEMIPKT